MKQKAAVLGMALFLGCFVYQTAKAVVCVEFGNFASDV